MGSLFTKQQSPKKNRREQPRNDELSQIDSAKLELRRTRTKLRKYQKQMEKQTIQINQKIKKLLKEKKKNAAKTTLRLRKLREIALERTDNQILNLEQMISSIEQTEFNAEMIQSIETGNTALESLHKIMSLEYVEDVMEQADEYQVMNDEISNLIGESGYLIDDEDIAADLELLESELNGQNTSVDQAMNLPIAPNHDLIGNNEEEEEVESEEEREERTMLAAN